jgi:hypothetical protein
MDYQKFFEKNIQTFFEKEGINGMIDRVSTALTDQQITMFVCHSLAHDIGHYAGYPENFANVHEYLTKKNLDFCGSGFLHGVEGQLAFEPYPDNVNDLYAFCKMAMPLHPYYGACYHGAGHAFLEQTHEPHQAMRLCDKLKTDADVGVAHCYRGIFSEYANFLHESGREASAILVFCDSLSQDLQSICADEVNGLELPATASVDDIKDALAICLDTAHSPEVQRGCVHSVGGVAVDRELGNGRMPSSEPLLLLNEDLSKLYIQAALGAFTKTALLDPQMNFNTFCDSIPSQDLGAYCRQLVIDHPVHQM